MASIHNKRMRNVDLDGKISTFSSPTFIRKPNENDIISYRGFGKSLPGIMKFRELVRKNHRAYQKSDSPKFKMGLAMKIRDELLPGRFLKKEFASQEGYRLMDEDETLTKIMYAMRDCRSSAPIHNTSSRGEIFNNDDDSDDNNHNNGDEEETSHDVNEYEQEHAHEPFLKRFNHGQMKDDDDDNDEVYTDTNEAVEEALTDNEEEQLYLNEDEGEEDVVEEYDAGNKNYNQEYDVPPSRLAFYL